jgi:hypothetical protein
LHSYVKHLHPLNHQKGSTLNPFKTQDAKVCTQNKQASPLKHVIMAKGNGGKPSTTGKPSGKGRDNNPPKPKK